MSRDLVCGIATSIYVCKETRFTIFTTDEILSKLSKEMLSLYTVHESKNYVVLDIKEDIFEKHAVNYAIEQQIIANVKDSDISKLNKLRGLSYSELMEILKEHCPPRNFQLVNGNMLSNNISYIAKDLNIFADLVLYIIQGKTFMEEYYTAFNYFRESIIRASDNPIKYATFISICG